MVATTGGGHIRSLTGLRFFAAFSVVIFHTGSHFDQLAPMRQVTGLGYVGVSFFFILSGFVLQWSRRTDDSPGRFYWRRFARVWPLHILTTIIAIAASPATGKVPNWAALPFVATLTQAWIFPGDWRYAFNGASWSLSCEAFFYLLFPLLAVLLDRAARPFRTILPIFAVMLVLALAGAALFPTSVLGYLFYSMPAFRAGEFIVGILLARALRNGWRSRVSLPLAVTITAAGYAVLIAAVDVVLKDPARLPYFVADLWMLPGFVLIIAAAASRDLEGKRGLLSQPGVVRLGQWSFALYLIHEPILEAAARLGTPTAATVGVAAAAIIVAVAASGVLYETFERPVERWLRHLVAAPAPAIARA